MIKITYRTHFDAAHYLPDHEKCGKVHGHTYWCEVTFEGPLDSSSGMVLDAGIMKKEVESVIERFDHKLINDMGLTPPTAELIASAILVSLRNLRHQDDRPHTSGYKKVVLWETPSFCVEVEK
jgi:6-pyruvoyltetrahydropterin/6-carboxytetrahydropterin synthase